LAASREIGDQMRAARARRQLTRRRLALETGVSERSIKAYEAGERLPSRDALLAIARGLRLDRATQASLMAAGGFAPEETTIGCRHAGTCTEALLAERVGWPVFVLSSELDVVGANPVAERVWGLRVEDHLAFNLLAACSHEPFSRRVLNWSDFVGSLIGLFKSIHPSPLDMEWWPRIDTSIRAGEPALVTQFSRLWETTAPAAYCPSLASEVTWRMARSSNRLRFRAVFSPVHTARQFTTAEWYPADVRTWRVLDRFGSP
jgi:transcriptional regulator with XRE-family HTH domain